MRYICARLTSCHVSDLESILHRKNDQSSSASEPAEEQRQIKASKKTRERKHSPGAQARPKMSCILIRLVIAKSLDCMYVCIRSKMT